MTDRSELLPSLAVFDFDGTLAEQRGSWGLLYRLFGIEEAGSERTAAFWNDELSFQQWCSGNVTDWRDRGVTRDHLDRAAAAIKLTTGVSELLRTLAEHGVPFGVLSSGIVDLTARLERFDPVFVISNEIVYEDDVPVDVRTHVGPNDKGDLLIEISEQRGISTEEILYVGDSHSDTEAFEEAGTAILFDPDDRIPKEDYELVDAVIEERDLEHVLDYTHIPDV